MNEQAVAALLKIKQEMGADFLRNTQRVRAFLSDFLPAQPGERRYAERQMLVSLLEAGVPQQLAARHPWSDAELAALAQRSAASLLLDAQATHQGVRVWHFVTHAAPGAAIDIHAILGAAAQATRQQLNVTAAQQPQQPKPPVRRPAPPAPSSPPPPKKAVPGLFKQELASAVENGDAPKVQRLLAVGADANAKTHVYVPGPDRRYKGSSYETTMLIRAIEKNHTRIVKLLLDAGADVNAPAGRFFIKRTPLMHAVEKYASVKIPAKIVKLLLDAGADVNAKDEAGDMVLIRAAYNGDHEIVQLLLDAGADVDAKDAEGDVALIKAVEQGHAKIVKLLLDAGSNVNAQNKEGATVLMHAIVNGSTEIIQMLRDAGAQ